MRNLIVIWLVICPINLRCQITELEKAKIIEQSIEFLSEAAEEADVDYTTYLDYFYQCLESPINLNQASFEDLIKLNLLTDIQCNSILSYRNKYGHFLTVFELVSIETLSPKTIEVLIPFVFVGPLLSQKTDWKNVFTYGKNEIILRYQSVLESKDGYLPQPDSVLQANPNKSYLGDPNKYYLRYKYAYKDKLQFGFTAEKDPGETFFKGKQKYGFDFYSGHIIARDLGPVKKIIIGDYQANFGQGLTLWSGFNLGKSPQVLNIKQYGNGIRAYTSANEANYFRGTALTFGQGKFETTLLASYKKIDANLSNQDSLDTGSFISAFQITGNHRTVNENDKRKRVNQLVLGGATSYQLPNFKLNFTGIYTKYDTPFEPNLSVYKQFSFTGLSHFSAGLDYQYLHKNIVLFGEVSTSLNNKYSVLNGLIWKVDSRIDLVFLHRYLDKSDQQLYSSNFTGTSSNQNGLYIGTNAKITKKLNVSAYYDFYTSKWLKYQIDGPSHSRELFVQANFKASRYANFYLRLKDRVLEKNSKDPSFGSVSQDQVHITSVRFNYSQRINHQISLKSRVEWLNYRHGDYKSRGLLMFQDIIYKVKKIPLRIYGRYAIFDTDSYDSRIYAYENDLLFVFSVPAHYYKGFRSYLMIRYDWGKNIDLWIKWGRFTFVNRDEISSGLERIDGNHKSEIKVQMKLRF